jgi:hypothetical protein
MARKPKTFAEASADELGVDSEGQAAQMEATDQIGAYGPDAWPVNWNGIILGALGTLAALLIFGLSGVALGAHQAAGPDRVILDWHRVGWGTVFFSIFGTFLSFALGGWIAGQIAGFRRAEPCMLHGACAWLAAIPVLAFLAGMGTAGMYGGWLSGLAPNHPGWAYVAVDIPPAEPIGTGAYTNATQPARIVTSEQVARAARNTALATVAALLLGLMGGVIGGWMSSGEPMTFTYYRTRDLALRTQ